MDEIDDGVIINLIVSMNMALLENLRGMLPAHNRKARLVGNVENAIKELAKLNARPLDTNIVNAGVTIWNRCMAELELFLLDFEQDNNVKQYRLFLTKGDALIPYNALYQGEVKDGKSTDFKMLFGDDTFSGLQLKPISTSPTG